MSLEIELHKIQAHILRELLFKESARFSELNVKGLTNDHFTFHIKKLVDLLLVNKEKTGKYSLTNKGKEFANRLDTDAIEIERQPKVGVLVVAVKKEKGVSKYLIQKRLKQPYFGFYGFVTGKVKWGESVYKAGQRELKEETGLMANFEFMGLKHKTDLSKEGLLLEDKFFLVLKATKTKGRLKKDFEGGSNSWLTEEQIKKLKNQFEGLSKTLDIIKAKNISFSEQVYKVKKY